MSVALGVFSRFTLVKSKPLTGPTTGKTVAREKAKHRVSGLEKRTENAIKVATVIPEETGGSITKATVANLLPDAEGRLGKSLLSTSTMN